MGNVTLGMTRPGRESRPTVGELFVQPTIAATATTTTVSNYSNETRRFVLPCLHLPRKATDDDSSSSSSSGGGGGGKLVGGLSPFNQLWDERRKLER